MPRQSACRVAAEVDAVHPFVHVPFVNEHSSLAVEHHAHLLAGDLVRLETGSAEESLIAEQVAEGGGEYAMEVESQAGGTGEGGTEQTRVG